jgi:hypothetical protein
LLDPTLDSSQEETIFRFRYIDSDDDVDEVERCFVDSFSSSKLVDAIDIGENSTKLDCPSRQGSIEIGGLLSTEFNK